MNTAQNYDWLKNLKVGEKVRFNDPEDHHSGGYTVAAITPKEGEPVNENTEFKLSKDSGRVVLTLGKHLSPATADQFASVWDALSSSPHEASMLKALSEAKMWFDAMMKSHPEPLTMNSQTGGALLTGHISRINMAMLFGICRDNKIDTETLEKICRKHNQPIPPAP